VQLLELPPIRKPFPYNYPICVYISTFEICAVVKQSLYTPSHLKSIEYKFNGTVSAIFHCCLVGLFVKLYDKMLKIN